MAVLWPPVEDGIRAHLQRVYITPLRLDAAFDTEEECAIMLRDEFPDLVEEDLLDALAQMTCWKDSMERPFKRNRSELAKQVLFRLPFPGQASVQDEFTKLTRTSAICILEMHTKRKQRKYREDPADARAKRFDAERKKYSRLLSQIIVQADLPIVALVKTLDDPQAGWLHIFAARRGNTLKNRFKVWQPFRQWLEWHRGYQYPRGVKDAIDYMQHRVSEGCGRSVPQALHTALAVIEQIGRVPDGARISDDPLWKGHVKSWSAELAEDAPPGKPAEMYTTAILISLELTVVADDEPLFVRALAWVALCMVWGAMRCDDVQAVLPHRSILSNFGLRLVLGKSKTTGPDKVQKEVSVHIFRTASLTGEDWLKAGYDLWSAEPFNFRWDYLVMEPNKTWTGRRRFLPPSGLSAAIAKLLGSISCPRRTALGWELMPAAHLVPDGLEAFFSGHSPRNYLTSVAAALGFQRDERAYLGRWSMGMVSSEEYVRTSRQVIFKIQRAVNKALVEGSDEPFHEDETIDKLAAFAADAGANPNRIKKRHTVLSSWMGKVSLGGVYPTLEVLPDDWDPDSQGDSPDVLAEKVAEHALKESLEKPPAAKYFVTVSRRVGLRRLHLTGCFVKPDRCCEVIYLDEVKEEDFDAICQACRRRMLAESGKEAAELSSSTASSSTTVSAVDEGDEPMG
jgi:hypothetical protein